MDYRTYCTSLEKIYLFAFFLSIFSFVTNLECENEFDKLVGNHNCRIRPKSLNGTALIVKADIHLYSITSVSELNTEYSIHMVYQQTWFDEYLKLSEKCTPFLGNHYHASRIWFPRVHVVNSKEIGSLCTISEGAIRILIDNDTQVTMSNRVHVRVLCKMEFHRYPLDKQDCYLEIESSDLMLEKMQLQWNEDAIKLSEKFYLTGYYLNNHSTIASTAEYPGIGNFSKLTAHFQFQREFGHFLLDIYIPGILFVVTSWTSFWVEIPAAPARVTLGITTMLTLITSEKSVREKLPKMSYVHALDIWNVVCTGFIFASLVEYALVNYIYHKDKRRKQGGIRRIDSSATFASIDTEASSSFGTFTSLKTIFRPDVKQQSPERVNETSFLDLESATSQPTTPEVNCVPWILPKIRPQDIANGIDRKCRIIFPLGFVIFNIVYWAVLFA